MRQINSSCKAVLHALDPQPTEITVVSRHGWVLEVEATEAGCEALWLEGHEILVEAAHEGPAEDLPVVELVEEAALLQEVQEGIL